MLELSSHKILSIIKFNEISHKKITCDSVMEIFGKDVVRVASKKYGSGNTIGGYAIAHLFLVISGRCSIKSGGKSISLHEGLATLVGNGYYEMETPSDSGCDVIVAWLRDGSK
ncbi:hypothetical protein [Paraburkholderia rhizosphaerae]|uniref:AraC-like protein n=1 Tax=Paraburkholderia rhizosphaerae TaxID=480658 RepID=A0A4R8LDB0_9BURK|nr:hypothetical protein [Paraburkholderia rhizosphaerae]TDY40248.1 hypothetical protein BX592_1261 [Paraburkholderia rhizosphaerae]